MTDTTRKAIASKNGGHFSLVTWELRLTFAKPVFPSEQLFFAFPLRGKANKSWTPQIKKPRSPFKIKNVCRYFKFGFCKYLEKCRFPHVKENCESQDCDVRSFLNKFFDLSNFGLDQKRFNWKELDWKELDWKELDWKVLHWKGLYWKGLDWKALDWKGLEMIKLERIDLARIVLERSGFDWIRKDGIGKEWDW